MSLDAELIIFGENNITVTNGIFDLFILLAKFFIYKCKVADTLPNIEHFKCFLKSRYQIERSIHYSKSLHSKFQTKWAMYHNIFIMYPGNIVDDLYCNYFIWSFILFAFVLL